MSRESVEALVERWMDDAAFRSAVRTDPERTIRATGLELTAEEWVAVQGVDWSLSDEELTARTSAAACSCGT